MKGKMYNLKNLCQMKERTLFDNLVKTLKKYYPEKNIKVKKYDYIFVEGKDKVMLNAHLDTVHHKTLINIFHDKAKNVIWSPEGIGGDDRCGVYAILKVLEANYKPYILFTTGEESGGIGAYAFTDDFPKNEFNIKYIVGLDRRGVNDAVFYNIVNYDFIDYILSYDFKEEYGSFSDISIISPSWEVCSVNLSVGYYHEHTKHEYIKVDHLQQTINKVINLIIDSKNIKKWKYKELKHYVQYKVNYIIGYGNMDYENKRNKNKDKVDKDKSDKAIKYTFLCINCWQEYSIENESLAESDLCIYCENIFLDDFNQISEYNRI